MNDLKSTKWVRRCILIILAAFFAFKITPTQAAPDFMPISEVKAGMRGIAKTVVAGKNIEEFGIEVLGVMPQKGPAGDLILVRTFGDVIERTGGIAQGMSGSPVYIGGRLVGAIAYGWGLTDHKTGMVTPIADMLKLWELPDVLRNTEIIEAKEQPAATAEKTETTAADSPAVETGTEDTQTDVDPAEDPNKDKADKPAETINEDAAAQPEETVNEDEAAKPEEDPKENISADAKTDARNEEHSETKDETPASDEETALLKLNDTTMQIPKTTTLMASGFGENALTMLKKELKPYGLKLETGSGGAGKTEIAYRTPEPGSMISLELIRGDVSLASMGTVTYVADGKILAFGHPFMKRGNVNYFLSEANVYTTMPGLENSFKVGESGAAIGFVNQDRGAGVAGKLGVFPRIVPVRVTVHDKTMGISKQLAAQIAYDEDLAPILTAATVFNSIEKVSDRVGPGTARIKFDILAQDLPVATFSRENMFYTTANVGEIAITELFEAISILTSNQYKPINIIDVKVEVEIDKERRIASIMSASAAKTTVKPGETIEVTVKLKPYRNEPVNRKFNFTVPKNQPEGSMMVSVRGGGVISLAQLVKQAATENVTQEDLAKLLMSAKPKPRTFEDAIKNLTERDRYNDIVMEIVNMDLAPP
ncbi:MAG: hypothetical protein LBR56_01755, partial [Sporomusaceae bacterium]|nr:hypothetical protein [Sporomusaceae bacterium]